MNNLITTAILLASATVATAMLPSHTSADEQEFTCREGLFGTTSCESDSGTKIKSRPDLFGNTNSTVTSPDGSALKCRSRQGLFGGSTTICE